MDNKNYLKKNEDDSFPRISIITVCYNRAKLLKEAIHSIIRQNCTNIEYIIVDGGSMDSTLDIIHENESFISKWISEPDKGIYDAMNKGIEMATGDYIAFLNSDDWYVKDAIDHVIKDIRCNDFPIFCYEANIVSEGASFLYRRGQKENDIRFKMVTCHQGVFAKRSLFYQYGMFDTKYKFAADYEWLLRMYNKGIYMKYDDFIVVNFREGGVSSTNKAESQREAKSIAIDAMNMLRAEKRIGKDEYDILNEDIGRYYDGSEWRKIFRAAVRDRLFMTDEYLSSEAKKILVETRYSIFGCGVLGQECMCFLEQLGLDVVCFLDNKYCYQGEKCNDHEIKSPKEIKDEAAFILISSLRYENEINEQLIEMGMKERDDFLNYSYISMKLGKIVKEHRDCKC